MHAIKITLILTLAAFAPHALATIVPMPNQVVEAVLHGESGSLYVDGYVQLNKDARTVSLVLQPVMSPCPAGDMCPEVMPAPVEFFLENAKATEDECGAVSYQAEQGQEPMIKVTITDNTKYSYETCPSFLPVPETEVQVEQISVGPNSTESKGAYLSGTVLSHIRY
ncbi:MAG TPA: hypothetical protein VE954_02445 [Oligoflexus sp.]|uniref:hypothetical protein n=1 Tax=Oligoflexus sp. TaxID=1971216 RepID=UPI002D389E54|nr:hypothetical protein [Oligoflexus sp.]HYX31946.1 hypothetical protein [Oligoflexus sp.]